MDNPQRADALQTSEKSARDWALSLAQYRKPNTRRAVYELAASLLPFVGLWALAWWMIPHSAVLSVLIAIVNGGFLVRLFAIQHDCGHGAFVKNLKASNWIGRCLGVLTLTPYAVWRKSHSHHHSTSGNLDHRGMGDVHTKTVAEYAELNRWQKFGYRLYRSPFVLFGLGPVYLFVLQNRLPIGLMTAGRIYWISAMGTNAVLALMLGLIAYFGGIWPLLLVFAPTVMTAAAAGVWLFYVQHQFEETHWDRDDAWNIQDAAFHGSSYYKLPAFLNWLTAYIGVHHVHHLNCRIPFYRLPEVLSDHTRLAHIQIITLAESFHCARLHLWDEDQRRLLSFAHANKLIAAQRPA